jgi:Mrp family chromosome partitioning ATPase
MQKPERTVGELWCDRKTAIRETHICVFVGSFRVARRSVKVAIGANQTGITQLLGYHINVGPSTDRWVTMLESVADNCSSKLVPSTFRDSTGRRLLFVTQSNGEIWDSICNVFGSGHAIQACRTERERRVLALAPEARRKGIKLALTKIWKQDEGLAVRGIEALAEGLRSISAEASEELETGLTHLFTINRLGLPKELHRFLATTGLISKFEANLRAKIRRRVGKRVNSQASTDALQAVCRESLLGVEEFEFDLTPLATALKASNIASRVVPISAEGTVPEDVKSDEKSVTSFDASVRIRVTANDHSSDEPSLAMCVSWIKSVTTQMRSLLSAKESGTLGDHPNRLPSTSHADSLVDGKAIILRPDRLYTGTWRGRRHDGQIDRDTLPKRARMPEDATETPRRADSIQGNNGHGFSFTVKKQLTSAFSRGLSGRWNSETKSLLPVGPVRGVLQHAGWLAKRIKPISQRMRHRTPEHTLDHSTSRDIATLADRLFVIPGLSAPRCVVFSGLDSGVGCSSIATSVAQMLASRVSGPVCIVDANCRDPFLHNHFQIDNSSGLIEASTSPESVLSFAQRPSKQNLWVLPTHRDITSPTGYPSTDHMRALVNELIAEFDYVLIDGPPLGTTFDAAVLARMADGLVLVLEAEKTLRERARSVKSDLELAEVRVLAAVLNKCSFTVPDSLYSRFGGNF